MLTVIFISFCLSPFSFCRLKKATLLHCTPTGRLCKSYILTFSKNQRIINPQNLFQSLDAMRQSSLHATLNRGTLKFTCGGYVWRGCRTVAQNSHLRNSAKTLCMQNFRSALKAEICRFVIHAVDRFIEVGPVKP